MKNLKQAIKNYNQSNGLKGGGKMTAIKLAEELSEVVVKPNMAGNYRNYFSRVSNGHCKVVDINLIKPICLILGCDANFLFGIEVVAKGT